MGLYQDSLQSADGGSFVNLRDAAGTGLTSTLNSGKQSLDVNITGGGSSSAVADKTAFSYGTTVFQNIGGVFQDTSPTLSAGTSGALRLTTNRAVHMNLRTAAGVEIGVSGSAVIVDGSAVTQPISAAALPLPTGASTSALQTTGNTSLSSILALMSSATGTITSPAITTGSTTALASNAGRKGFSVENNTLFPVYLAMAATATTSAFSARINPNTLYEQLSDRVYTGIVTMISTGSSGNVQVTEYT